MDLAGSLDHVRKRISAACAEAGRSADSVRLLPVSKTHPVELIREAYAAGERTFGENKIQEGLEKSEALADLVDLRWAVIGHLQTNKIKYITRFAAEFHALDSMKVAEALDRRLQEEGRGMDVFIQVNSSAEESKFGLDPEDIERFAQSLTKCQSLQVKGLMTLAVFSSDQAQVEQCFARMQELQERLRNLDRAAGTYDELSMGMSNDFELAIKYGATVVRIGEAIFGRRLRPQDYWPGQEQ